MSGVFFHHTAVRVRAGTRGDRAGTPEPDWSEGAVDRLTIAGLNIASRTQDTPEVVDSAGVRVEGGWWLQTAPGCDADIEPGDRIEWDGKVLEVEGSVMRFPDPFTGQVHHMKCALKRVTRI